MNPMNPMNPRKNLIVGALAILSALLCLLPPVALITVTTGCATGSITNLVTPARVESVVALGTYIGGRKLVRDGRRAECERALLAIQSLKGAGNRDMEAIAKALIAAGIKEIETPEGLLVFGLLRSVFTDKYGPEGVLNDRYATAVLNGSERGLSDALAVMSRAGPTQPTRDSLYAKLAAQAKATRPAAKPGPR
jgi:hypothetical protein